MNISNNNNNTTTTKSGVDSKITPSTSKSDNCKDSVSKSSNDDVCKVNDMLKDMSMADDKDIIVSVCANCGKEGNDVNNICNKCKQVKYCNAACKKKHRHKHKKDCEEHLRLAAERAAELHDEELFKEPPNPYEDCPICFMRLPTLEWGKRYKTCCGKRICSGCVYAPVYDNQGNEVEKVCAFCRTPGSTSNEVVLERERKRMEKDDPIAIYNQGCNYKNGVYGFPQDHDKALELWHRAGELGNAEAHTNIGIAYYNGDGVAVDKKKANHYYELAAIGGDEVARFNLAIKEKTAGNFDRSLKHFMIAVICGDAPSLNMIKEMHTDGYATKDDYTKALRLYQEYLDEIKSDQRDKAAEFDEDYRYY